MDYKGRRATGGWIILIRKIRIAAYDGSRLAKTLLGVFYWAKQAWHITFGHTGKLNELLPDLYTTQFLVLQLQEVCVHAFWSTCSCGITRHVYRAMLLGTEEEVLLEQD